MSVKVSELKHHLEQTSHDYLQELHNLKIQVQTKEKKLKKFEYIEVHYFEPTETLGKDVCFILNNKLNETKDLYERNLQRLQQTNFTL